MEARAEERGRVGVGELPLPVAHRWGAGSGTALPGRAGSPQPTRVLVVDDDRDQRDLLTGLIDEEAFAAPDGASLPITQAENGRVALATLRAEPEARWIILLDLRMPEMDGMQVWKAIAEDAALVARCAVALLTADNVATVVEWQRQAGAPPLTTVFHKPYEPENVLRWMERHLADEFPRGDPRRSEDHMPTLPTLAEAEAAFRHETPAFATTSQLDDLRTTDYGRLDRLGHIYLDYTGAGLNAESQIRAHMELLNSHIFGNPHSTNPTSMYSTIHVEQTRAAILAFFHASPDEYAVIFTLNASGALKLVGESYPFQSGDHYLLTFDNHNSVNGIREFARAAGAEVTYTPVLPPDMRIDAERLTANLREARPHGHNLFAYPAQSNFSGVQHALDWIPLAQELGWDVLLDAAAFVPSNTLDLSRWRPDFVAVSFYKMFGYPTGVGCLISRKKALARLHRPWFAGGTISVASVQGERYYLQEGPEGFEDGTLNYLSLPAVEIGLRHMQDIGVEKIHTRVTCLTEWLLLQLTALTHASGEPLVRIYGPPTGEMRGGIVALNFYDRNGDFVDHRLVERRANQARISLRTGCFCNPGDSELALGISADELTSCFVRHEDRLTLDEFRRCIDTKSTGAVRISIGLVSTFADVYACIDFARTFLDKTVKELVEETQGARWLTDDSIEMFACSSDGRTIVAGDSIGRVHFPDLVFGVVEASDHPPEASGPHGASGLVYGPLAHSTPKEAGVRASGSAGALDASPRQHRWWPFRRQGTGQH